MLHLLDTLSRRYPRLLAEPGIFNELSRDPKLMLLAGKSGSIDIDESSLDMSMFPVTMIPDDYDL